MDRTLAIIFIWARRIECEVQKIYTVDCKYFVCKNFVVFNFCGWSQPQNLNMDHTLYATAWAQRIWIRIYTIEHPKKKEGTSLSYSKRSYKATLWISSRALIEHQIRSWLRGVVKSTQWSTSRSSWYTREELRELQMIEQQNRVVSIEAAACKMCTHKHIPYT